MLMCLCRQIWPVIAWHFGMEVGEPQELSLPAAMADKAPVWSRIVEKHGLQQGATWEQLGTWKFAVRHVEFRTKLDNSLERLGCIQLTRLQPLSTLCFGSQ